MFQRISHNPYFNRWFSAIFYKGNGILWCKRHNPYFNRWFSAIGFEFKYKKIWVESQSLF